MNMKISGEVFAFSEDLDAVSLNLHPSCRLEKLLYHMTFPCLNHQNVPYKGYY